MEFFAPSQTRDPREKIDFQAQHQIEAEERPLSDDGLGRKRIRTYCAKVVDSPSLAVVGEDIALEGVLKMGELSLVGRLRGRKLKKDHVLAWVTNEVKP